MLYTKPRIKHIRTTLAIQKLSNNLNPELRLYRRTGRLARVLRPFESLTAFLGASVLIALLLRLIVVFFVVFLRVNVGVPVFGAIQVATVTPDLPRHAVRFVP